MAIVGASLGVILQLFASGLNHANKISQAAHRLTAQRLIIHALDMTNPAATPTGKGSAEGLTYHWTSTKVSPFRTVSSALGSQGHSPIPHRVALFSIKVAIDVPWGKTVHFSITHIGWKPVQ